MCVLFLRGLPGCGEDLMCPRRSRVSEGKQKCLLPGPLPCCPPILSGASAVSCPLPAQPLPLPALFLGPWVRHRCFATAAEWCSPQSTFRDITVSPLGSHVAALEGTVPKSGEVVPALLLLTDWRERMPTLSLHTAGSGGHGTWGRKIWAAEGSSLLSLLFSYLDSSWLYTQPFLHAFTVSFLPPAMP